MILAFILSLLFLYLLKKQVDKLEESEIERIIDPLILEFSKLLWVCRIYLWQ